MRTYEFTIVGSGLDPTAEDFESRFYDAGCDDATVSFQRRHVIVDFARSAASIDDAVATAVAAVRKAGAVIDRIEPDPLVSLADIAARCDMTRAAMTQYAKGQRGSGFPSPVAKVTSPSPLWAWSEVSRWLHQTGKVSRDVVVEADAIEAANNALSANQNLAQQLGRGTRAFEAAL